MTTERDILEELERRDELLPPLRLEAIAPQALAPSRGDGKRFDAVIEASWEGGRFRFAVEVKGLSTPKRLEEAMLWVESGTRGTDLVPMVVTPYLSPDQIERLEQRNVSGVDLCGNGVVIVPGRILVLRTGQPNRYPASSGIRNVYRGASSLVARVFLLRCDFDSVGAVEAEVERRGGRVSLSTVSKVLSALNEDLVIRRQGRGSRLTQPEELLDRLAKNYKPPQVTARKQYRWEGPPDTLAQWLATYTGALVMTGEASVGAYATMPREKTLQCYCRAIETIERMPGGRLEESTRFPDLELVQTTDPTAYFDPREGDGVAGASPIQCWLELQAGDKRQQDAAETVRAAILKRLEIDPEPET